MWKKFIIFLLSFLSVLEIVSSQDNYEYFIHHNHCKETELCLSHQLTKNSLNTSIGIKITSSTNFNQTDKLVQIFEQADSLIFFIQNRQSFRAHKDQWPHTTVIFWIILAKFFMRIYYRCKYIIYLLICTVKGIEPSKHLRQLIRFITSLFIDHNIYIWLCPYFSYYTRKFFTLYKIEEYAFYLKHNINLNSNFVPEEFINTLYTTILEMKSNATEILIQQNGNFDIIRQKEQLKLFVGEFSFTSTVVIEVLLAVSELTMLILALTFGLPKIKELSKNTSELERKIDLQGTVEEKKNE